MDLDNVQDIEILRAICKKYMVKMKKDYVYNDSFEDFEYTFKKGFWYPFDQNEYGVELHSGDECEVTASFSYEGAEEYFEKW